MTHNNDRTICEFAKEFLQRQMDLSGLPRDQLEIYLSVPVGEARPNSIPKLLQRILESAQNTSWKSNVIGKSIEGGVEGFREVLFDFNPERILDHYKDDPERLFEEIKLRLNPTGKKRSGLKSIWPKYCRTILSASEFLIKFKDASEFYVWADSFDVYERSRIALPIILQYEIYGLGLALACDFVKELGYHNFAKPDRQLRKIFVDLGLCEKSDNDYMLFKRIVLLAKNAEVTPYNADKVFWLIGSGKFYRHSSSENDAFYKRGMKQTFIEEALSKLRLQVSTVKQYTP